MRILSESIGNEFFRDPSIQELLIYALRKKTVLVELFSIIGTDNTLRLISYFGGSSIVLPSKYEIKQIIQHIGIYSLHINHNMTSSQIKRYLGVNLNDSELDNCIKIMEGLKKDINEIKKSRQQFKPLNKKELEDFILDMEKGSLND